MLILRGTHRRKIRDNTVMEDKPAQQSAPELEPEDYYFEGPYMVFTEAYHLKRGFCCGSGCRHCPYRDSDAEKNGPASGDQG
jgi:hypothetical protein